MANYKVVNADELDSKFTAIGNAIREKTGKTDLISEDDMPKEIASIQAGGETVDYLAQRLDGSITNYENDKITVLASGAFAHCDKLERVSLPNVITMENPLTAVSYQFYACAKLKEVNIPKLTNISVLAFQNSGLEHANFPLVKTIDRNGLGGTKLTEVNFPECETLSGDAFFMCSLLTTVNLPKLKSITTNAFRSCLALVSINVSENNDLTMTINSFAGLSALENFTIGGKFITAANVNFSGSPKLTLASAKNIIEALPDYSGTTNEHKYSVLFSSETLALLEAEGATSPNGNNWLDYVFDKGWNY